MAAKSESYLIFSVQLTLPTPDVLSQLDCTNKNNFTFEVRVRITLTMSAVGRH